MNLFPHRDASPPTAYRNAPPLVIRWTTPEDAERLSILAELDEAPIPPSPLLAGFVGDELWTAVSLSSGATISDPFKPSAEVTGLVRARGRQLVLTEGRARRGLARRLRRHSAVGLSDALRGTAAS